MRRRQYEQQFSSRILPLNLFRQFTQMLIQKRIDLQRHCPGPGKSIRKNIQQYHKVVLGNELDSQLEVYDLTVKQKALDLKSLVRRTTNGNFLKLVDQLETSMEERRQYMSANMRSDTKLIKYYDEEKQKINTIEGWRAAKAAEADGVISFYLDGYEHSLTPDTLENLTIDQMRTVLAGGSLSTQSGRSMTDIYRIVNQNHWYLADCMA